MGVREGFQRPPTAVDVGLKALRDNDKCPKCGGWLSVMNVAVRGFKAERITEDTHCTCPGGPARNLRYPTYGGEER